jgi:hypothetical protein
LPKRKKCLFPRFGVEELNFLCNINLGQLVLPPLYHQGPNKVGQLINCAGNDPWIARIIN